MGRLFEEGGYYHIYNRGNHRQPVFLDRQDYCSFLKQLKQKAGEEGVQILAYCLMRNHYHLLIKQEQDFALSKYMTRVCMGYVYYFNRKYQQVGSLFQGRYKAKSIKTIEEVFNVSQYIHLNPSDFADPSTYEWSSVGSYLRNGLTIADPSTIFEYLGGQSYEISDKSQLLAGAGNAI